MANLTAQQLRVMPVTITAEPDEGPIAVPLLLDFTANTSYTFDTQFFTQRGAINQIQTVFVDGTNASANVVITIDNTNQVVIVKPGTQGYFQLIISLPFRCTISCSAGPNNLFLCFLNVEVSQGVSASPIGNFITQYYANIVLTPPPLIASFTTQINFGGVNPNQGIDDTSSMLLKANSSASVNEFNGGLFKAYPVTPFSFVIGIDVLACMPYQYAYMGIGAIDNANNIQAFTILMQNSNQFSWGYGAQHAAGFNVGMTFDMVQPDTSIINQVCFIRWRDDGVNRFFEVSRDLTHWFSALSSLMSRTLNVTPTKLGLFWGQSVTNIPAVLSPRFQWRVFHFTGL